MGTFPQFTPSDAAEATLADRYVTNPFTLLDARTRWWQDRKRAWIAAGIQSDAGRDGGLLFA